MLIKKTTLLPYVEFSLSVIEVMQEAGILDKDENNWKLTPIKFINPDILQFSVCRDKHKNSFAFSKRFHIFGKKSFSGLVLLDDMYGQSDIDYAGIIYKTLSTLTGHNIYGDSDIIVNLDPFEFVILLPLNTNKYKVVENEDSFKNNFKNIGGLT